MKNIMKYMLVALTALSFSVANAGDLAIKGDAKASYVITGSDSASAKQNKGKGLGVANEFSLSASGELDNGMTWAYAQDIDGSTVQDDAKLTLTTDYGTLGVFISEGGLDSINKGSQSVISRPSDTSYDENMFEPFNLSGMNTIQYHTPADLLPFGLSLKLAHAPSTATGTNNSYKAGGAANLGGFTAADTDGTSADPFDQTAAGMGRTATHYRVDASPVDGLTIGADYVDFNDVKPAAGSATIAQEPEAGAYYATYTMGIATIGYSKGYAATAVTTIGTDMLESIENTKYSVALNVNDNLSISYENEESNPDFLTSATATYTLEASGIQAAYTMGGMTLAVAMNEFDNIEYTDGNDINETVFSVAMAF
jgi:hypothetical protein